MAVDQQVYDNSTMRRYLADLEQLQESEFVQSEVHLNGEAYSILTSDCLNFYLVQVNQMVQVRFEANIQVPSAKNVFLFEARNEELGMSGYFALVFGLDNYSLVLIDPQYQRANSNGDGYKVQWTKAYQSLSPENGAGSASFVTLIADMLTTTRMGLPEQVISFLVGASNHHKVFELRLSLRLDRESLDHFRLHSVLTQTVEGIIYQEAKTITSRISNFISAKIGFRGEQGEADLSKCVKNATLIGDHVVIITGRDLIIVRYSDRSKIFEQDFIEYIKYLVEQEESSINMNLLIMKNVLQFNYLASHACSVTSANQICVSLFARREQVVQNPQSSLLIRESHIIQHSRIFSVNEGFDSSNEKLCIFEADKTQEYQAQIKKAAAFSFEYFSDESGTDVATLLFAEIANSGKVRVFEYSLFKELSNISELPTLRMSGYSLSTFIQDESRQLIVRASIISDDDISTYEYDPVQMRFSNAVPIRVKHLIQQSAGENESYQQEHLSNPAQYQHLQDVIVSSDSIQRALIHILDSVGTHKYGPSTKSQVNQEALQQQQRNAIKLEITRIIQAAGIEQVLYELKKIIEEQVDLAIDDNTFYNRGVDEIQLVFSDSGLIEKSIQQKLRKLEVIIEMLSLTEVIANSPELFKLLDFIDNLKSNIYIVHYVKSELLESTKVRHQHTLYGAQANINGIAPTDYSLDMRILTKAMYITAEKFGFNKLKLAQAGATATNIVLAKISSINTFIESLSEIGLSSAIQNIIPLKNENDRQVQNKVGELLIKLFIYFQVNFNEVQQQQSFFSSGKILHLAFQLCERLTDPEVLVGLGQKIVEVAAFVGLENTAIDQFNIWREGIVLVIEQLAGKEQAFQFAEQYRSRYQLTRLVFDLGPGYYGNLHKCLQEWEDYVQESMETVYKLEVETLQQRRHAREAYRGLQIFDIFEGSYLNQLSEFLYQKNKKLFALLMLRAKQSDQASTLIREVVLPQVKGVQTTKLFSSLGLINAQIGQPELPSEVLKEHKFTFKTMLQHSTNYSIANPDEKLLAKWTKHSLINLFKELMKNHQDKGLPVLKEVLSQVNNTALNDLPNFKELTETAWELVFELDNNRLQQLTQMLDQRYAYTEANFEEQFNYSFTSHLAEHFKGTNVAATQEIFQHLRGIRPALSGVLKHIESRVNATENEFASSN